MLHGLPAIYGIHPHATSTVPEHELGTIGFASDGRAFVYALNNASTAAVAGELQQARAEDTGDQSLVVTAAAIGVKQVTTAAITVTANQYANGYLIGTAEASTGNGIAYRIKSHPAATAAATTFTLYDPILVAMTATTQVDLVPNPYDGVIQNPTTASGMPAGSAMTAMAVSTYGWLQVGGPGVVKADADALVVGTQLVASNGTAGCVEDVASTTQAIIGVAMTGIAAAEFGMADLRMK